ncbi:unnamed protein product, partial [Symbiodinium sp. CCMP2456]
DGRLEEVLTKESREGRCLDLPERDVAREVEEFRFVSHQKDLLVAKVSASTAMVHGSSDFQTDASPIFSLVVAAMPPVQSRFAAAGLVAGLAASAFVAPSTRGDRQLRAGGASKVPARTPVSQQKTGDGLAALAILGAGLAAAVLQEDAPPLFQPSEQFGATEPVGFFDPLGFTKEMRMKELNNGRMAMISVLGIFAAEMATGKDAMQQFGL